MSPLKLFLAAMAVLAGCSTASIVSKWQAPNAPALTSVVTLSPAPDGVRRRSVEDRLAQQLAERGVHAVPGYMVLTDQERSDRTAMLSKLRADGFDGIVTMRLVDAHQRLQFYPDFDTYWGSAWGPYGYGTLIPQTILRIEVNAYSLVTKQLVWSALSRSVDPNSSAQAVRDVSKLVSDRLARDRVIGATQAMR